MAMEKRVSFTVNGRRHDARLPAHRTLLEVLRELGYVEVKCGCEKGDCGACAVLLDGAAIDSCLTLAWQAHGAAVVTVRGLGEAGRDHPLQRAFIETGAVQCGYCIPGMILLAKSFLVDTPTPSDEEIRRALASNLCRCTGYVKMIDAVKAVARAR